MKIQIPFLSKKHLNKSTGTRYVIKKVLMNKLNHLIKKMITLHDRDPPWMTDFIKSKIQWINSIYKNYQNSSKSNAYFETLQLAILKSDSIDV